MLQFQGQEQQPAVERKRSDSADQAVLNAESAAQANKFQKQSQADQQQPDRDAMQAELDRLKQAYDKIPQVLRLTSVSAKSADAAAYMHYFEEKVEQIGNVNYPREARSQGIFGQVQLIVVLLADGRIKRIEVSKGSGSRLLDQAAVRSVQLASPFKPFPKELRNRDEIHIIRTWQYQSNNVLTTN